SVRGEGKLVGPRCVYDLERTTVGRVAWWVLGSQRPVSRCIRVGGRSVVTESRQQLKGRAADCRPVDQTFPGSDRPCGDVGQVDCLVSIGGADARDWGLE